MSYFRNLKLDIHQYIYTNDDISCYVSHGEKHFLVLYFDAGKHIDIIELKKNDYRRGYAAPYVKVSLFEIIAPLRKAIMEIIGFDAGTTGGTRDVEK